MKIGDAIKFISNGAKKAKQASGHPDGFLAGLFESEEGYNYRRQQEAMHEERAYNERQADKARNWQTSERNAQNLWNLKAWNLNNQYNSPSAQMSRISAAGLNPNLMYGLPSAASSTAEGSSAPSTEFVKGRNEMSRLESLFTKAQLDNLIAQTEKTKADTKKTKSEAKGIDIDNIFKTEINPQKIELLKRQNFTELLKQVGLDADNLAKISENASKGVIPTSANVYLNEHTNAKEALEDAMSQGASQEDIVILSLLAGAEENQPNLVTRYRNDVKKIANEADLTHYSKELERLSYEMENALKSSSMDAMASLKSYIEKAPEWSQAFLLLLLRRQMLQVGE